MTRAGYVAARDLLRVPAFKGEQVRAAEIRAAVRINQKQRFQITTEDSAELIRAVQGHDRAMADYYQLSSREMLRGLDNHSAPDFAVHGTKLWVNIRQARSGRDMDWTRGTDWEQSAGTSGWRNWQWSSWTSSGHDWQWVRTLQQDMSQAASSTTDHGSSSRPENSRSVSQLHHKGSQKSATLPSEEVLRSKATWSDSEHKRTRTTAATAGRAVLRFRQRQRTAAETGKSAPAPATARRRSPLTCIRSLLHSSPLTPQGMHGVQIHAEKKSELLLVW